MSLTAKQQLFIEEYLVDLNATQAAIRSGYSEKTAYSVGHENLKKPEIAAALQEAKEARSESTASQAIARDLAQLSYLLMGRPSISGSENSSGIYATAPTQDTRDGC